MKLNLRKHKEDLRSSNMTDTTIQSDTTNRTSSTDRLTSVSEDDKFSDSELDSPIKTRKRRVNHYKLYQTDDEEDALIDQRKYMEDEEYYPEHEITIRARKSESIVVNAPLKLDLEGLQGLTMYQDTLFDAKRAVTELYKTIVLDKGAEEYKNNTVDMPDYLKIIPTSFKYDTEISQILILQHTSLNLKFLQILRLLYDCKCRIYAMQDISILENFNYNKQIYPEDISEQYYRYLISMNCSNRSITFGYKIPFSYERFQKFRTSERDMNDWDGIMKHIPLEYRRMTIKDIQFQPSSIKNIFTDSVIMTKNSQYKNVTNLITEYIYNKIPLSREYIKSLTLDKVSELLSYYKYFIQEYPFGLDKQHDPVFKDGMTYMIPMFKNCFADIELVKTCLYKFLELFYELWSYKYHEINIRADINNFKKQIDDYNKITIYDDIKKILSGFMNDKSLSKLDNTIKNKLESFISKDILYIIRNHDIVSDKLIQQKLLVFIKKYVEDSVYVNYRDKIIKFILLKIISSELFIMKLQETSIDVGNKSVITDIKPKLNYLYKLLDYDEQCSNSDNLRLAFNKKPICISSYVPCNMIMDTLKFIESLFTKIPEYKDMRFLNENNIDTIVNLLS